MKYETYRQQLDKLKEVVINDLSTGFLSAGALEIELRHPLIYQYIDDQTNEVIARVNIEQQHAIIDDNLNMYSIRLDNLPLDTLLELLCEFEHGNYEVWEEVAE